LSTPAANRAAAPASPADEASLLALARAGDEAAVRSLVQHYNRRLFRMARGIVRDDAEAEDVVQECYVRGFLALDSFRGEAGFGTWLGRIVINEALGRIRRRRNTVGLAAIDAEEPHLAEVIPFPTSAAQDPERSMARLQIRRTLEAAIDRLPPDFRFVLIARLVEGMSVEETAELAGIRQETVKTRLHRARKLLRASLEETIGPVLSDAFPFDGERCVNMADRVMRRLAEMRGA
jgi:RNA polymerase sigma-70 factor (ECF subfamily)